MANPTLLQKEQGQHLWFSLIALGFQPDTAASSIVSKTNIKYLNLGPNMFDKPNKDAFYIVTNFLLEKFNPTRFHEAYRYCWPVLNHKADAEFRKVTCCWLREIMEDAANAGSKVVASLFLSPGGPKFISLMLHLANRVMLQEMKTFNTNGNWVPEAAATPASSTDMAVKRLGLIRARFLKTAVGQDRLLHEYQRRAQALVKSMRDIKAEGAKYDELLKRYSPDSAEDEASRSEKIIKVRSLWSHIDAMLSAIKEEQITMETVLKGNVDQYVLDGTDRVLNIPRCLQEQVEQLPHQLSSGSVYEAGQLNLLCVVELFNHALQLLKQHRCQVSAASETRPSPQNLQEKFHQMSRVLQELHLIRQKLSKEEIPEIRTSIRELEADWDKRWTDVLKETPLVSFLNEDPAFGFLSPMAPLSFEPAAEASYRSSVFSQFPAKLPEEKPEDGKSEEVINTISLNVLSSPSTPEASEGVPAAKPSRVNTSLDWLFDTPRSPPLNTPPLPPLQESVRRTARRKVTPPKSRTQILDLEYENLADQFADAVTTAGPSEGRANKGLDLESLLTTLQRDPFSTRKQLPRTPESLILDVKSSWRKAVEEDKATDPSPPAGLDDSLTGRLSPLGQPQNASPPAPTATVSRTDSTPVCQQEVGQKSSLLWDTFHTEALDLETLPELPSCDSLSLEDEDEQRGSDGGSPVENERTTQSPLWDKDWLMEPGASENTNKVFSLDLDSLDPPSPGQKEEYCLPKLITFSPIDDMKC